jgi:hypothetical protein
MTTREIWRWELQPGANELALPKGAYILSVGTKNGIDVEMWGVVEVLDLPDPNATETRRFTVIGTGHPWRDDPTVRMDYLGTVVIMSGAIVVHVFEGIGIDVGTPADTPPSSPTERSGPDEW